MSVCLRVCVCFRVRWWREWEERWIWWPAPALKWWWRWSTPPRCGGVVDFWVSMATTYNQEVYGMFVELLWCLLHVCDFREGNTRSWRSALCLWLGNSVWIASSLRRWDVVMSLPVYTFYTIRATKQSQTSHAHQTKDTFTSELICKVSFSVSMWGGA